MIYRRFLLVVWGLLVIRFSSVFAYGDQLYTITEQVERDERLTTMQALLSQFEELQALLNDPAGEFTLFAPADGAWRYTDAEGNEVDLTSATNDPVLAEVVLRYYIVPASIYEAGYSTPIEYGTMLPGYTVGVVYDEDTRQIYNDASAAVEKLPAENGSIVILDSGLPISGFSEMGREYQTPGSAALKLTVSLSELGGDSESLPSVMEVLTDAGDFTTVLRLFETFPEATQRLESGGLYTLIAPTDTAIVESGYADLIEAYLSDTSEESYALRFLERRVWPGYFDLPSLRRLAGEDGRTIEVQTVDGSMRALLTAFDYETGTVGKILRVDGKPVNEQPLLARNAIIYVQEELGVPG